MLQVWCLANAHLAVAEAAAAAAEAHEPVSSAEKKATCRAIVQAVAAVVALVVAHMHVSSAEKNATSLASVQAAEAVGSSGGGSCACFKCGGRIPSRLISMF